MPYQIAVFWKGIIEAFEYRLCSVVAVWGYHVITTSHCMVELLQLGNNITWQWRYVLIRLYSKIDYVFYRESGILQFISGVNLVWNLGVMDPGQNNFDFSRQISEKFRFFQANFRKISIFPGKLMKNFDFPGKLTKYFDFFSRQKFPNDLF